MSTITPEVAHDLALAEATRRKQLDFKRRGVQRRGEVFVQTFYEVQQEVEAITQTTHRFDRQAIREHLLDLQLLAIDLQPVPVVGQKPEHRYHTGDVDAEKSWHDPFSTLPFSGLLEGVCLVFHPYNSAQVEAALTIRRPRAGDDRYLQQAFESIELPREDSFMDGKTMWIPFGGIELEIVPIHLDIELDTAAQQYEKLLAIAEGQPT